MLAFQDGQISDSGAGKSNVSNPSLFEGKLAHPSALPCSSYTKLAAGALISIYINTNRGKSSTEERHARNFRSNSCHKGDVLHWPGGKNISVTCVSDLREVWRTRNTLITNVPLN